MRLLPLLAVLLTLAGCFTAGKRGGDGTMAIYDLGPAIERREPSQALAMALEVRAPLWFDTLGIDYRLAYADSARLREYGRARWAGPPAQLIQQRLIGRFGWQHAGQGRSRCVLRLEITEFSQVFDRPELSRGVLQGSAQWLDRGRNRLAERAIDIAVPAATPDARGGVAALTTAVGQLTAAIQGAEEELLAAGKLQACRG